MDDATSTATCDYQMIARVRATEMPVPLAIRVGAELELQREMHPLYPLQDGIYLPVAPRKIPSTGTIPTPPDNMYPLPNKAAWLFSSGTRVDLLVSRPRLAVGCRCLLFCAFGRSLGILDHVRLRSNRARTQVMQLPRRPEDVREEVDVRGPSLRS